MADLTGKKIKDTYKDLLQVSNSNSGLDGTLRDVEDGEGTVSALKVSTGSISVDSIKLAGTTISSTTGAITIETASNGDITITPNGTGEILLDGLKWPQADGTANYVLKTDGSAQLSWTENTGGVSLTTGSVPFSDGTSVLAEDNANLFWDDTNNRLGIGTASPLDDLHVVGALEVDHTAVATDEHAIEICVDAAGFGDIKGLDIAYTTGAIAAGEDEAVILANIDESTSTGGVIAGVEILTTTVGSATVYGTQAGVGVHPILHGSGTFGDMDYARYTTSGGGEVDCLTAFTSTGTDVTMFTADNDYIIIGDAATFSELEFILDTTATGPGIKPTFQFSTGGSGFTTFTPTDGTNGFRNTGIVAWLLTDISGSWATNASGFYEIKIIRTHGGSITAPIEDLVQIAGVTQFTWNKDGLITAKALDIAASNSYAVAGTDILSDSGGTMTLSNVDALDATTEATVEGAIDTLANLVSVQGLTVTLADAGADAIWGWDDTASAYENLTQAEVLAVIGSASTSAQGVVELATGAETNTGTDATRAVTPDGLDDWTGSTQIVTVDRQRDTSDGAPDYTVTVAGQVLGFRQTDNTGYVMNHSTNETVSETKE